VLFDLIGRSTVPATNALSPAPSSAPAAAFVPSSTPPSTPSPTPATYAVVTFGGSALPSDRAFAERVILEAIRSRGVTAVADALQPQDLGTSGAQACIDTGAATIVGGTLETTRNESLTAPSSANAAIALQVYDCRTQRLYDRPLNETKSAPISSDAIRAASEAALGGYFSATPSPAPHGAVK
jgi:hypothetical protein